MSTSKLYLGMRIHAIIRNLNSYNNNSTLLQKYWSPPCIHCTVTIHLSESHALCWPVQPSINNMNAYRSPNSCKWIMQRFSREYIIKKQFSFAWLVTIMTFDVLRIQRIFTRPLKILISAIFNATNTTFHLHDWGSVLRNFSAHLSFSCTLWWVSWYST
jgi:hypothetical protein